MRTYRHIYAILLLFATSCSFAQTAELAPETILLKRIRDKMADNALRQPDYTCLETVERSRQPTGAGTAVQDTLRLEVAMVDGTEMFAWPGAKEFQETPIRNLVTTGMFGNGNFGIYARMLFFGSGPVFEYRGTSTVDGRRVARYDFQVSQRMSGYHLTVAGKEAVVGFHGSIYADAETQDLSRLEVIADNIPAELGLSEADDRIDYARVRIGDDSFLLPAQSNLRMSSKDLTDRNRIRFTGCRKFTGESALIFDDPEFEQAAANQSVSLPVTTEVTLPPDFSVQLQWVKTIDLATAAVGDEVDAKLAAEIRQGKQVLVPKGAVAHGRIWRLDRMAPYYVLLVRFTSLDWPGGHAPLQLKFDRTGAAFVRRGAYRDPNSGAVVIPKADAKASQELVWFWTTVP